VPAAVQADTTLRGHEESNFGAIKRLLSPERVRFQAFKKAMEEREKKRFQGLPKHRPAAVAGSSPAASSRDDARRCTKKEEEEATKKSRVTTHEVSPPRAKTLLPLQEAYSAQHRLQHRREVLKAQDQKLGGKMVALEQAKLRQEEQFKTITKKPILRGGPPLVVPKAPPASTARERVKSPVSGRKKTPENKKKSSAAVAAPVDEHSAAPEVISGSGGTTGSGGVRDKPSRFASDSGASAARKEQQPHAPERFSQPPLRKMESSVSGRKREQAKKVEKNVEPSHSPERSFQPGVRRMESSVSARQREHKRKVENSPEPDKPPERSFQPGVRKMESSVSGRQRDQTSDRSKLQPGAPPERALQQEAPRMETVASVRTRSRKSVRIQLESNDPPGCPLQQEVPSSENVSSVQARGSQESVHPWQGTLEESAFTSFREIPRTPPCTPPPAASPAPAEVFPEPDITNRPGASAPVPVEQDVTTTEQVPAEEPAAKEETTSGTTSSEESLDHVHHVRMGLLNDEDKDHSPFDVMSGSGQQNRNGILKHPARGSNHMGRSGRINKPNVVFSMLEREHKRTYVRLLEKLVVQRRQLNVAQSKAEKAGHSPTLKIKNKRRSDSAPPGSGISGRGQAVQQRSDGELEEKRERSQRSTLEIIRASTPRPGRVVFVGENPSPTKKLFFLSPSYRDMLGHNRVADIVQKSQSVSPLKDAGPEIDTGVAVDDHQTATTLFPVDSAKKSTQKVEVPAFEKHEVAGKKVVLPEKRVLSGERAEAETDGRRGSRDRGRRGENMVVVTEDDYATGATDDIPAWCDPECPTMQLSLGVGSVDSGRLSELLLETPLTDELQQVLNSVSTEEAGGDHCGRNGRTEKKRVSSRDGTVASEQRQEVPLQMRFFHSTEVVAGHIVHTDVTGEKSFSDDIRAKKLGTKEGPVLLDPHSALFTIDARAAGNGALVGRFDGTPGLSPSFLHGGRVSAQVTAATVAAQGHLLIGTSTASGEVCPVSIENQEPQEADHSDGTAGLGHSTGTTTSENIRFGRTIPGACGSMSTATKISNFLVRLDLCLVGAWTTYCPGSEWSATRPLLFEQRRIVVASAFVDLRVRQNAGILEFRTPGETEGRPLARVRCSIRLLLPKILDGAP